MTLGTIGNLLAAIAWLVCVGASENAATEDRVESLTIVVDDNRSTPVWVRTASEPGPTVMIVGGMHGNEPAGAAAAEQIRHWPIVRGRLVVLPRANVVALQARKRYTPGVEEEWKNLNRNFPMKSGDEARPRSASPQGAAARSIWELVQRYDPDWLLDLHEGFAVNRNNPKSVGSTVIAAQVPPAMEAARAMLRRVNLDIPDEQDFQLLKGPVAGSLARAFHEQYQRPSMILETTYAEQRLPLRVRQHRLMVQTLLGRLGMLGEDALESATLKQSAWRRADRDRPLVAVFDDRGVGPSKTKLMAALRGAEDVGRLDWVWVDAVDIRNGVLADAAVVVFPGGSGSKQSASLGESGREAVRQFVGNGGAYLGVCAGGYLACDGFSWGLKIVDARTVSNRWRRGVGKVEIQWQDSGRQLWSDAPKQRQQVHYANGPIWMPNGNDGLSDYQVLATFSTELARNNTPEGVMVDSPAVIHAGFGAGRVVCCSPHFELTDGKGAKPALGALLGWLLERTAETP